MDETGIWVGLMKAAIQLIAALLVQRIKKAPTEDD